MKDCLELERCFVYNYGLQRILKLIPVLLTNLYCSHIICAQLTDFNFYQTDQHPVG